MDDNELLTQQEISWQWFKFHAIQRFSAFYYYLLIIGALAFGYIRCFGGASQLKLILPFLSFFSFLVSIAFLHLEVRNVELVNIGRKSMRRLNLLPAKIDYANRSTDTSVSDENKSDRIQAMENAISHGVGLSFPLSIFLRVSLVKHNFWFRLIYLNVVFISILSFFYSFYEIFPQYYYAINLFEIWKWILIVITLLYAVFVLWYLSFNTTWKRTC